MKTELEGGWCVEPTAYVSRKELEAAQQEIEQLRFAVKASVMLKLAKPEV